MATAIDGSRTWGISLGRLDRAVQPIKDAAGTAQRTYIAGLEDRAWTLATPHQTVQSPVKYHGLYNPEAPQNYAKHKWVGIIGVALGALIVYVCIKRRK